MISITANIFISIEKLFNAFVDAEPPGQASLHLSKTHRFKRIFSSALFGFTCCF